ncbi:hypothetical protein FB451DRAFT_1376641 [Mycena latifolia]|nr:hypothetical protein FB451DRAFT_1376641 [Mycena latifolia]
MGVCAVGVGHKRAMKVRGRAAWIEPIDGGREPVERRRQTQKIGQKHGWALATRRSQIAPETVRGRWTYGGAVSSGNIIARSRSEPPSKPRRRFGVERSPDVERLRMEVPGIERCERGVRESAASGALKEGELESKEEVACPERFDPLGEQEFRHAEEELPCEESRQSPNVEVITPQCWKTPNFWEGSSQSSADWRPLSKTTCARDSGAGFYHRASGSLWTRLRKDWAADQTETCDYEGQNPLSADPPAMRPREFSRTERAWCRILCTMTFSTPCNHRTSPPSHEGRRRLLLAVQHPHWPTKLILHAIRNEYAPSDNGDDDERLVVGPRTRAFLRRLPNEARKLKIDKRMSYRQRGAIGAGGSALPPRKHTRRPGRPSVSAHAAPRRTPRTTRRRSSSSSSKRPASTQHM